MRRGAPGQEGLTLGGARGVKKVQGRRKDLQLPILAQKEEPSSLNHSSHISSATDREKEEACDSPGGEGEEEQLGRDLQGKDLKGKTVKVTGVASTGGNTRIKTHER